MVEQAVKYFNYLLARVPTDSEALYRLGCLYGKHGDEAQAIHYQQESYRFFPVNLEALTYLGIACVVVARDSQMALATSHGLDCVANTP